MISFDFSRWETWVVLIAVVIGVIFTIYQYKPQDKSVLNSITTEETEFIVIYYQTSLEEAEKMVIKDYPPELYAIIDKSFDKTQSKAIFRIVKIKK